jgi:hypothetical protein
MDLPTMLAEVRRDLRDEDDENYQWTDDELERHIARAVLEFSAKIPCVQMTALATTPDSRDIDISGLTDRIDVIAVEYPIGEDPKRRVRYSLFGDTLTILGDEIPDGSNCNIYWGTIHTLDAESSTLPSRFEHLIAVGAEGYALNAWGDYAINKVNLGGAETASDYRASGNSKLKYFRNVLKRQGSASGIAISRLYTPALPVVSETRDPGP